MYSVSNNFNSNDMDVRVEPFRTRFQISIKNNCYLFILFYIIPVTQILDLWASLVTQEKKNS